MRLPFFASCALLLAAGGLVARPAEAVRLSATGGQVLIFPYYTVNGGLNTLFQIANGSGDSKALRLRFREGSNGRDVLSFNVYLPPHATWAGAITADPSGFPRLLSAGGGCSIPQLAAAGQSFVDSAYAPNGSSLDGGSAGPARAREGLFEVIEMGVVEGVLAEAVAAANCGALLQAWLPGGTWAANPATGIRAPGGELSGSAVLANVADGVMYSYRATLIDGFSGIPQHTAPDASTPNLASAAGADAEVAVTAQWQDGDGLLRAGSWPRDQAVDALSAVLARVEVNSAFNVEAALGADTEWVISFPTKHFYTDNRPGGVLQGEALAPFSEAFNPQNPLTAEPVRGGACTSQTFQAWGRDAGAAWGVGEVCTPGDSSCELPRVATCHATQVLVLGAAAQPGGSSPLLGSARQAWLTAAGPGNTIAEPQAPSGDLQAGRAQLGFTGGLRPSVEGLVPRGLPVIALSLERYTNGQVEEGVLANYAAAEPHHGTAETSEGGGGGP